MNILDRPESDWTAYHKYCHVAFWEKYTHSDRLVLLVHVYLTIRTICAILNDERRVIENWIDSHIILEKHTDDARTNHQDTKWLSDYKNMDQRDRRDKLPLRPFVSTMTSQSYSWYAQFVWSTGTSQISTPSFVHHFRRFCFGLVWNIFPRCLSMKLVLLHILKWWLISFSCCRWNTFYNDVLVTTNQDINTCIHFGI